MFSALCTTARLEFNIASRFATNFGRILTFDQLRFAYSSNTLQEVPSFKKSLLRKRMSSVFEVAVHPDEYPAARRDTSIVENLHGVEVADPYRWLENPNADETKAFVDALNSVSTPFLNASDVREKLTDKLTRLWDYEKYGCTSKHGDYYYYNYNSGLQNQWVYYKQKSLNDKGEIFLDPNTFSDDGTTFIRQQSWTQDGSIFAYGISEKGSDWVTIKFRTADGVDLPDVITGVKFSGLDWISTNEGVFYSKYPEQHSATEGSSTEKLAYHSLFYHKLGTDCKDDALVAQFRENENFMTSGFVTEDGRYLFIEVDEGCDPTNQLYYFDLSSVNNKVGGKWNLNPLFTKFDAKYDFIDNDGDTALIKTNHSAPMFKVVRVKLNKECNGEQEWETVIPEDPKRKLNWAAPVGNDKLLVSYLEDVKSTLYVHDLNSGEPLYQIPLEIGSFGGCHILVYRGDFSNPSSNGTIQLEEIRRVKIEGIDSNQYKVTQIFYPSKDGTKIPMYIISPNGAVLDGSNPTILNGYGGFNCADLPYFSISRLCLMRYFGATIACANLRGGSEYGETWHEAGMRDKKQNVFDDFIYAAQYLIDNKYTSPGKLAIHGGSNGGLLVAACSQQRPDLFGAVLNRVGVLDMLRFHKFTIGSAWIPEYGNPEDANDFKFIYKYSPLHNLTIENGTQLPSTLLLTADHDDRVVPSHTLKYIAQLYHIVQTNANWQRNPLLAKIEVRAGHGAGKPTAKIIAELVDMYSFLHRVLKLEWKD